MSPPIAPAGSWCSPFTAESLTADIVGLAECCLDGADVYWLELRPAESGRSVLVRRTADGGCADVTPAPFDVRSRVHEYGGGAYAVHDGLVVFVNESDQRIYRVDAAEQAEPTPISPVGDLRYGDLRIDRGRRLVICVREDHDPTHAEPVNTLVGLRLDGSNDDGGRVLVSGSDFVSSPELDTDGRQLAWVTWDHPNMPWDGSALWAGRLDEQGGLSDERQVAGGPREAIGNPRWAPDGQLVFLSDRTGWWNFYAVDVGERELETVALLPMEADFGRSPGRLGLSGYDFTDENLLLCTWTEQGFGRLGLLDPGSASLSPVETESTSYDSVRSSGDFAVFIASHPASPSSIVRLSLTGHGSQAMRRSTNLEFPAGSVSRCEPVEWRNANGEVVHGFLYPPTNAEFEAPAGELPPLLVHSHGGPTGMTVPGFNLGVQYWTSRGFAVLDVNYGGSTGHGREYRERLLGKWGIVDVADCAAGATALAVQGRVDPARLAIRGWSAGGYTTLCALAFTDVFQAGASHFGVADLETLARDTHKFESRYLDSLVGPYPEARDRYVERSPIHHLERLDCPMILFQGAEDKVVPPAQAQDMADAVRAKGVPVVLLMFEGGGHGFLRAETIKRTAEAELYFYGRVFGFELADPVEPVTIDNLQHP